MIKQFVLFFAVILLSAQLNAKNTVEWKIALDWKSTLTPLSSPAFKISELVREMSNGKFIIKVDGREKHNIPNLLQSVKENQYQIIHTNSANWIEQDINTLWFTGTPLGMTMKEQYSWFYYGGGKKYMSLVYDKFNLLAFPAGDLGSQMGGWFKKEITQLSDFNGLKINSTGITSEILSMYQIDIKQLPTSQINKAFLTGELDVINGTSPSMDIKMGYHKVAPYYYTSWDKPSSQTQFLINQTAFHELHPSLQVILKTAIKSASHDLYYENFYESLRAWDKIQKEYPNIQIKSLPKNVLKSIKNSKRLIFEQYSKENKLFKEIYKSQKNFIKKARNWSNIEEFSYIKSINELD